MGSIHRVLSETYTLLKSLPRSKGAIFWIILFPIFFYGLEISIWGTPNPPTVSVGVYVADDPTACNAPVNMSRSLVEALKGSGLFRIQYAPSPSVLEDRVRHGRLDAGLIVPENYTCSMLTGVPATLTVLGVRSTWANYSVSVLEAFLSNYNDMVRREVVENATRYVENTGNTTMARLAARWLRFIASPVRVETNMSVPPLLATSGGIKAFYAIGMIGVESLFIGLSVGVSRIVERREDGSLRLVLSSPITSTELLVADTLSGLTAFAISALAVALTSIAVGARYNASPEALAVTALLLALGAIFMIGLGLLLAPLARSSDSVTVIVNSIAFPAMFLGGIIIPADVLPSWASRFAMVFPQSRLTDAVRRLLLYGYAPREALSYALPAIAATVVVYAVGAVVVVRLLERSMEQ